MPKREWIPIDIPDKVLKTRKEELKAEFNRIVDYALSKQENESPLMKLLSIETVFRSFEAYGVLNAISPETFPVDE